MTNTNAGPLYWISSITLLSMGIILQYPTVFAGACIDNDGDLFYANDACRPNLDPDDDNPCIPDPNSEACNNLSEVIKNINNAITEIKYLIDAGDFDINSGQTNSLISKLQNAIDNIESDKINGAIGKLNAFIDQINGFINSEKISQEDGQRLISDVQNIIDSL